MDYSPRPLPTPHPSSYREQTLSNPSVPDVSLMSENDLHLHCFSCGRRSIASDSSIKDRHKNQNTVTIGDQLPLLFERVQQLLQSSPAGESEVTNADSSTSDIEHERNASYITEHSFFQINGCVGGLKKNEENDTSIVFDEGPTQMGTNLTRPSCSIHVDLQSYQHSINSLSDGSFQLKSLNADHKKTTDNSFNIQSHDELEMRNEQITTDPSFFHKIFERIESILSSDRSNCNGKKDESQNSKATMDEVSSVSPLTKKPYSIDPSVILPRTEYQSLYPIRNDVSFQMNVLADKYLKSKRPTDTIARNPTNQTTKINRIHYQDTDSSTEDDNFSFATKNYLRNHGLIPQSPNKTETESAIFTDEQLSYASRQYLERHGLRGRKSSQSVTPDDSMILDIEKIIRQPKLL